MTDPIRIHIDDKPTRSGFHEMADLAVPLGYTAAGAGWTVVNRNTLAARRAGEAIVRDPKSGDSITVIAATPEAAIERMTRALRLLQKGS